MKNKIIKINDISDIDTSKITVYDLKNRYIDKKGNIFGIKFNNQTKKVEIIKLMRTHSSQVYQLNKKISKKKQDAASSIHDSDNTDSDAQDEEIEPNDIDKEDGIEKEIEDEIEDEIEKRNLSLQTLNPDKLIEETVETLLIHKERINGMIVNLKKSKFIKEDNKTDLISLEDYFRTIDIEGIQKTDKILNYHSEMLNYPRSINYYQSKLDKKGREILEQIISDENKALKFIYYYEMCYSIRNLYRQIRRMLMNLDKFLKNIDKENLNSPMNFGMQQFEDGMTSLKNTIQECDLILDDFVQLENYILNFE